MSTRSTHVITESRHRHTVQRHSDGDREGGGGGGECEGPVALSQSVSIQGVLHHTIRPGLGQPPQQDTSQLATLFTFCRPCDAVLQTQFSVSSSVCCVV